jgi:Anti-sigma factor NepR
MSSGLNADRTALVDGNEFREFQGIFLVPGTICGSPNLSLQPSHGGPYPVPKKYNQIKLIHRGEPVARLSGWPERWLRPADRLDYAIRRWVTPVPPEVNPPVAATREVSRSTTAHAPRNEWLLTDIQAAIGRYLRAEYDLAQPIPDRLAHLLGQLEQPDGRSEVVA